MVVTCWNSIKTKKYFV